MKKVVKVALVILGAALVLGTASCSNGSDSPNQLVPPATTPTTPATPATTTFTVTFDTDGGSEVAAQTVNNGDKAVKPTNPTKDVVNGISVAFAGWYSDSAKTKPFNFDAAITAETTVYGKWHDGFRSVPAKNFDGTAITTPMSQVFIAGRNLSLSAIYACDHEVTQGEYETYCKYGSTAPSSTYGAGTNYPAYYVSWYDAIVYCNLKSKADGLTPCYKLGGSNDTKNWNGIIAGTGIDFGKYCGPSSEIAAWNAITCDWSANGWRLPTEAEWEMLARGGNLTNENQTTYSGSDTIGDVAWCEDNSGSKTHEVKTEKISGVNSANSLGLYDMSGNVFEWCWDFYNTIDSSTAWTGPSGALSGSLRVDRGGGYCSDVGYCSVAGRNYDSPDIRDGYIVGFRVVRNAQ